MVRIADLSLLRALDDPNHTERPPGFDWRGADDKFHLFASALAERMNVKSLDVEGVESIQDASFHGQVVLPPSALIPGHKGPAILCISNFGQLAAIRPEDDVEPGVLAKIHDVLAAHGYVYVPGTLLNLPYDGRAEVDATEPTWWARYFEYQ